MDTVKAWCLSGCIALVIGSICTMIVPSIEKYKIIKLTISAFILAGIVVPVSKNIDSINIDMTEQTFVSEVEESEMSDNTFNLLK